MLPTSALLLVGIILKKPLATILICLYSINLILSSRHSDDSIGSLINFSHLNPNVVRLLTNPRATKGIGGFEDQKARSSEIGTRGNPIGSPCEKY